MGIIPRNIMEIWLEILKDMMVANTIITGARMTILITIMKDCWTFMTSVVSLVTMEGVENLSIFSKEKDWILSNMSFLRFLESPVTASAEAIPPPAPQRSEMIASRIRIRPYRLIPSMSASLTTEISWAMVYGIIHSRIPSKITRIMVMMAGVLYSRKLCLIILIIIISLSLTFYRRQPFRSFPQ